MKRSKLMSALVLGALSLGTAAYAQDRHDGDRHDGGDRIERRGEMNRVEGRGEMHGFERRGEMNRVQNDHRDVDRRDFGRREMGNRGPDRDSYYGHRWQRGERVPPEFRNRQYVVNDWRGHH